MKLSIVIPAHNEEGNLHPLLHRLTPVLESSYPDYEIIIVNDNSTDSTPRIIESLARRNRKIRPVHRYSQPGFGNAVKEGFKNATGDVLIPLMADLSDDPEDIPRLVRKIEDGFDVVYGSRFIRGGKTEGYPRAKMVANRAFNNLVRLLFGIKHKDVTNAFKAYRREVLEAIGMENLEAEGFDLTVEVPLKAHILGFKSVEVPVTWHGRERGEAKLKLSENGSKYGKRLLKLFILGNLLSLKDLFGAVARGSKLRLAIAVVIGILVLTGLFSLSGTTEVFKILQQTSASYLALGFLGVTLAFIMRTWRWSVLLRTAGHTLPRDMIFKSIMFGFLLNYLLPARIGDLARGLALKTTLKLPLGISLSTIVLERVVDLITITLLLGVSMVFLKTAKTATLAYTALAIALILMLAIIAAYRFDSFIVRKLGKPFIVEFISSMKQGLVKIYENPMALILVFLLSLPVWIFEISGVYFAAKAVGHAISPQLAVAGGITAFLAQTIPTTPAGLGVHEASMTWILLMFNIPKEVGLSIALVDHFIRAAVTIIWGTISTIHIGFASREYFMSK